MTVPIVTRTLRIRGLVQGVGFRWSLSAEARALGLDGWVRNRHDGSVEALLRGPADAVDALLAWSRHGPPAARVSTVEASDGAPAEAPPPVPGFEQLPTA